MSQFFFRNLKKTYPTVACANGVRITDTSGRTYLDACSGAVVANLGHGLAEINDAINDQLSRVAFAHTSQFVSEVGLKLASKVVELTPSAFSKGARAYFMSGLIADEVMTGLGRTGTIFGMNHFGVVPDIIALGKGMAAGYQPLAAVLASGRVVKPFEESNGVFEHGFTYSAHPVSCAAGLAAIEYLQKHNLIENVSGREKAFFQRAEELRETGIVGDIRGKGFMMGIELVKNIETKETFPAEVRISQLVAQEAMNIGLLVYPGSGFIDGVNGDHIMIAPPFTTSDAELDETFELLECALTSARNLALSGSGKN